MAIKLQLTKQQQQIAAVGAVLLVVGGVAYFKYFWKPVSARIDKAKTEIGKLESDITIANQQAARLPKIKSELVALHQQETDAEKRLPRTKDVPDVIDTVSGLAQKYKIELMSFQPGAPAGKQFFIEVPYGVSIAGGYHDVARFFAAFALVERVYNVRNVGYSAPNSEGKLAVTFTLISYQYKG